MALNLPRAAESDVGYADGEPGEERRQTQRATSQSKTCPPTSAQLMYARGANIRMKMSDGSGRPALST